MPGYRSPQLSMNTSFSPRLTDVLPGVDPRPVLHIGRYILSEYHIGKVILPSYVRFAHILLAKIPSLHLQFLGCLLTEGEPMSNLNSALQQLKDERKQAQAHVEQLDQAISVIEGLSGRSNTRISNGTSGGRSLSAAARKRISEAQRARWAQRKKQAGSVASAGPRAVQNRKPLSASARRRIAAAQKARWAKFRSQQKAAA